MQLVTVKKLSILSKKIKVNVYNKFSKNLLIYTVLLGYDLKLYIVYRYYEQPINYFKKVAGSSKKMFYQVLTLI